MIQQFHFQEQVYRNENTNSKNDIWHTYVHSSIIYNTQDTETTQMTTANEWKKRSCDSFFFFSDIYMNGDISILWVVLSLSFLFYFIYCFFIFLRVSFEAQKFLVLMKFNLSIFSLITYAFDVMSKKPLPNPR